MVLKIGGIQVAFNRLDLDVYKDGDTPPGKKTGLLLTQVRLKAQFEKEAVTL